LGKNHAAAENFSPGPRLGIFRRRGNRHNPVMRDDIELIHVIHAAIRRARQEGRPRIAQIGQVIKSLMAIRPDLSPADAVRLVEGVLGEGPYRSPGPSDLGVASSTASATKGD
jgi:hypothetical protein